MNNRLQLQLVFVLLAAISVTALSILLITNAIRSAESAVLADTRRSMNAATDELGQELDIRANGESSWAALQWNAKEISLRGISQTVLRSYPGIEGGFLIDSALAGYSFPTHDSGTPKTDLPVAERAAILSTAQDASKSGFSVRVIRGSRDLVALSARRYAHGVVWCMKRLPGLNDPDARRRTWLMAALVLAAFLSLVGTLATVLALRSGVTAIQQGLNQLKSNFAFQLPPRKDELGEISDAINGMAATRRRLEGELRREDRLRTIGRLTTNLAHEIRNPLNSIRLSMQSLESRLARGKARPEDTHLVMGEVDRLNTLLSHLLTFGTTQPPHPVKQAVEPVIRRCLQMLNPEVSAREGSVIFVCDNPEVQFNFDAGQLTQTLTNLLLNALEVSPPGKPVTVEVRCGHCVYIEVRDNGPGIPAQQRNHLFEAFHTTKPHGTGLGLAVSRDLVEGMGGKLYWRDSDPGATFVMEFPYGNKNGTGG